MECEGQMASKCNIDILIDSKGETFCYSASNCQSFFAWIPISPADGIRQKAPVGPAGHYLHPAFPGLLRLLGGPLLTYNKDRHRFIWAVTHELTHSIFVYWALCVRHFCGHWGYSHKLQSAHLNPTPCAMEDTGPLPCKEVLCSTVGAKQLEALDAVSYMLPAQSWGIREGFLMECQVLKDSPGEDLREEHVPGRGN